MDVGTEFAIPNPYGLLPVDFNRDMDAYRSALGFLGDLATGSEEGESLTANGADKGALTGWKRSDRFRRVYAKCQSAGKVEQEAAKTRWEDDGGPPDEEEGNPQGQRFVPLEEAPVVRRVFGMQPNRSSWGDA